MIDKWKLFTFGLGMILATFTISLQVEFVAAGMVLIFISLSIKKE